MQIKVDNVSFSYNNHEILKNINLSLKSGEFLGLFGDSGSGKSTLCKIIAGYIPNYSGNVTIDGKPLVKKGYNPIQLIFQHPEKTLNPRVKMSTSLNESWNVSQDIIDAFGIKETWLKRFPAELSGGELQRFALARALGPQTKFLIADEITTMLDANTQAQIWNIIKDLSEKNNLGVLVVSHDKILLEKICDSIVILDDINKV